MADYYKKVIYLSYLEQGNRIRGAGFIKIEVSGNAWSFAMRVSGMAELAGKKYDIYVGSKKEEYVIGKLFLHNGSGEWEKNGEGALTGTEGMTIGEVERFTIKISDTEVIEGKCQTISVAEKKSQIVRRKKGVPCGGKKGREEKGGKKRERPGAKGKYKQGEIGRKPGKRNQDGGGYFRRQVGAALQNVSGCASL